MNTISNVVSFHQFSKSQENVSWKDFVCVCGTIRSQHEFFLSPVVMKWSDEIWIFDLRNLRSYWENISKNKNILWKDMISSLIEKYFSSFEVVSFADHPWKSLLLARELQDRKMKGFFSDQHEFGMHVLATLRDQVWFSCVEDVLGFFSLQKEKKSLYRKQVQQFQLFLQRVKSSVSELPSIDSSAMERRFGYLIGKVWGWSFSTQEDQDIKSFPWRNFSFQKKPRVHRTLDHFMDQWSWIKERLIEDFDHLCQNPILTRFCKVVCLQWNLEFEKYGSIKKKIRFKNPFGLHEQSPGYDVFLFQMEVAFGQIKNRFY
ncbi:MAG: hypothetical protein R3A11_09950 [Bdellovibrionota bacterium]